MSTHNIGSVRLLFLSLFLLLAGAGIYWWIADRTGGAQTLIVRGGALEIEPTPADIQPDGPGVVWPHAVSTVHLAIAKAESEDEEFVLADPVALKGVKSVRIDVRVANSRMIESALTLTLEDTAVKMAVKEGSLRPHGDVWVHSGFIQDSRHKRYEIAAIEFFDRDNKRIVRYQNPDLGRRLRFRIKFSA